MPQLAGLLLTPSLGALTIGGFKVAGLGSLFASIALNAVAAALTRRKLSGQDQSQELERPQSTPPYRHVYGLGTRTAGTPVGMVVVGEYLYACFLLNSRPSAGGTIRVFADGRLIQWSGNPLDFGQTAGGTLTIAEGATTAEVVHGLAAAPPPTTNQARYMDARVVGAGRVAIAVKSGDPTRLVITLPEPAGVGGVQVEWGAVAPLAGTHGGSATNDPFTNHFRFWIGLGGQGHPPAQILAEAGSLVGLDYRRFYRTDRWTGRTVMWIRFRRGDPNTRHTRWPAQLPPAMRVEMDWCRVWDPRAAGQSLADPATWTASNNQALCLLDALLNNPSAPFLPAQVWTELLSHAADVADEPVERRGGGTDPRYRVGGVIVYDGSSELLDVLQPLADAGGGQIIRVGGRIGYAPGAWRPPVVTITDYLRDGPMQFQATARHRSLPLAVKAIFPDPESEWERSELRPHPVSGVWDGSQNRVMPLNLPMVPFARQAMRLQRRAALGLAAQKSLIVTLPPSALRLIAGSPVAVAFGDVRDGLYTVEKIHPAQWIDGEAGLEGDGDDGMAMAVPVELAEAAPDANDWNPEADEQQRVQSTFQPFSVSVPPPTDAEVQASGGPNGGSGAELFLRFFAPGFYDDVNGTYAPDDLTIEFEWNWAEDQNAWQPAPAIPVTSIIRAGGPGYAGRGSALFGVRVAGRSYIARVRTVSTYGVSAWAYSAPYQDGFTLEAPTDVSATPGAGQVTVSATSPAAPFDAIQFWGSTGAEPHEAALLSQQTGSPSSGFSYVHTGLPAGTVRRYWVRAVTSSGAVSAFSDPVTATPT